MTLIWILIQSAIMRAILLILLAGSTLHGRSQFSESFSDGNFSDNPAWNGHSGDWQVVASSDAAAGSPGSNTLRLAALSGSGLKFLSTQIVGSWGVQQSWSFWMGRRAQAATASNASFVWLWAVEKDVASASVDGYRIRFGDDSGGDELVLEKVSNGVASVLFASAHSVPNGITDYGFLVRVVRETGGDWQLFTSVLPQATGSGAPASDSPTVSDTPVLQGSATDNTYSLFDQGYIAFAASHTTGTTARAAAEFDGLVFSVTSDAALPVAFRDVGVKKMNGGHEIRWTNETESDVVQYEVQRSSGGHHFSSIAQVLPKVNDGSAQQYVYVDRSSSGGTHFYRVKAVEATGTVMYSDVIRVSGNGAEQFIQVWPGKDGLRYTVQAPRGNYRLQVLDAMGRVLKATDIQHPGGVYSGSLLMPVSVRGVLFLVMKGPVHLQAGFLYQ
jgi:hypothetical protein